MQDDLAGLIAERDSLKKANTALIRERDNAITQREYEKELKVKHWAEVHKLLHEHKTLTRERDEARAEVGRLRRVAMDAGLETVEVEIDRDTLRAQLTATQARLEEAVNILRASVWTEPTFHYQRHWFQRGRDFCAEYDAQQEGQSNG